MTCAFLWAWVALRENHEALAVLASFVGIMVASIVAFAALTQARTAARQAQIARERHEAQTEADLQRRIGENYTKAVEQLGSDKLPVRIGGIYTLERISRESPRDYWTVMETLTAFVRERARWQEPDGTNPSQTEADKPRGRSEHHPPTDIQAVLTVVVRRSEASRTREESEGWRLDFGRTDLRGANLDGAHLEGADLGGAHLEKAFLRKTHLEGANLSGAHLEGAILSEAHLENAFLGWAHLEKAILGGTHLEGAILSGAYLEGALLGGANLEGALLGGANLEGTHLMRAHLEGARFLMQNQLEAAFGDAETKLGDGLIRPTHWISGERKRPEKRGEGAGVAGPP